MRQLIAKVRGGVKVPHFKNTSESESVKMPAPPVVILPMCQHIGAPCRPVAQVGDTVAVGQVVGDTDAFVSAPIHSPVSGTVKAISPCLIAEGVEVDAIHIENDGRNTLYHAIKKPEINSREDFLRAARDSGIVGLGGAGFPTHAKLTQKDGAKADTLVINGAECEPYITSDYREMIENHVSILAGIQRVMECLGIDTCLIGIESNKPKAISLLADAITARAPRGRVSVVQLPARYPYGAEKTLIRALTGRTVPLGGLPKDAGVVALNVSTVAALNHYLETGLPLIQKRVTVAGGAIATAQNLIVPIGAPIQDIVDFCGGFARKPEKVIKGGPMMGTVQQDSRLQVTPIVKRDNAILCLTADETYLPRAEPCIRCGFCVQACPMKLMPAFIGRYAIRGNVRMLEKLKVSGCVECGSCAYVCPATRPLVQYIRQGKQAVEATGTTQYA